MEGYVLSTFLMIALVGTVLVSDVEAVSPFIDMIGRGKDVFLAVLLLSSI